MPDPELNFERDGAALFPRAAVALLPALEAAFEDVDTALPGTRLTGGSANHLRPLLANDGPVGRIAANLLGSGARPVRAVLFDKKPSANWSLAWHQDRVICVMERREVAGFDAWTVKQGALHVSPPFAIISTMITLRVHLDPVPSANAPLLIAPGSHRLGLIPEVRIGDVVARCGARECLADPGDVWAYSTPIVHASKRAENPLRRRVLQVDFAADDLPGGLRWAGI